MMADQPQSSSPNPDAPETPPEKKPSRISNGCGNLMLFLILVCLISIPFLVYFTDTPNRIKSHASRIMGAARANPEMVQLVDYEAAQQKIEELEEQLATARAAALESPAPPSEDNVSDPAEPEPEPEPEESMVAVDEDGEVERDLVPATLPRTEYELSSLWGGLSIRTILELEEGDLASRIREEEEAYELEVKLNVAVPKPNQSLESLAEVNPKLPEILPGLEKMLPDAEVSPLFKGLYDRKHERLLSQGTRIDKLETRHNYFDCETVLKLTHPDTGRKVLLMQGEMDVVADGTDGDRMPAIDDYISLSTHYQPTTSLGWAKRSQTPNPLLGRFQTELREREEEYAIPGLSAERNAYLKDRIDYLGRLITDLKGRSFLIAEADPFMVLPLSFLRQTGSHMPEIGDYCAIIYGDTIYPAICGDAGPSWKMGEASLFVAKTLNEDASPYNRPVSDLHVTYLVFPDSEDERKGPPDLDEWKKKVGGMISEIGGLGEGYELYDWRDVIAERRVLREFSALQSKSTEQLSTIEESLAALRAGVTEAKKGVTTAEEALTAKQAEVTAGAATEDAIPPLEKAITDAKAKVTVLEGLVTQVQTGVGVAETAVETVETSLSKAENAIDKPLSAAKTETTDVALAAFEAAEAAVAAAATETQGAVEAKAAL